MTEEAVRAAIVAKMNDDLAAMVVAPDDLTDLECEDAVIEKIRRRREAGRAKYGVSMERGDLSLIDWLRHAQEEAMDHAIYLQRAIREAAAIASAAGKTDD